MLQKSLRDENIEPVVRVCDFLVLHAKEIADARACFCTHKKRMQSDLFRAKRYMIGNSSCKQVVFHRLRCSGGQWNVEGARLMTKARTVAWLSKNNDWKIKL